MLEILDDGHCVLIELSVPISDLIKHFDIEFQNFARRKTRFELVYRVKGLTLAKYDQRWNLKIYQKKN